MKQAVEKIISDIFIVSFITFVVYLGLELLFEGLISNYFDLHILLVLVMVFGLAQIVLRLKKKNGIIY